MTKLILRLLIAWVALAVVAVVSGAESANPSAALSPLQVTKTVLLAETKGHSTGTVFLVSYGRVRQVPELKRYVEPSLYALILERAKLLEKVQASREKLGLNAQMELGALEANNVFLWEPALGKQAVFRERVSGTQGEVEVRDAFKMDGGVDAKSRTLLVFENRKGEWVLVRSQRWLSVDGKDGLDLARGLRREIDGFRRMLVEAQDR